MLFADDYHYRLWQPLFSKNRLNDPTEHKNEIYTMLKYEKTFTALNMTPLGWLDRKALT